MEDSICSGWTLTKPGTEHLALTEVLAEGALRTADCDHTAAVTHFLFILYDSHSNIYYHFLNAPLLLF